MSTPHRMPAPPEDDPEDWQARVGAWRRDHITSLASDSERGEADVERQRDLLESVRKLEAVVALDGAVERFGDPSFPRLDLVDLARDLDTMIEQRLPIHEHQAPPLPQYENDLEAKERERLGYRLERYAIWSEFDAMALHVTAAMVRLRVVIARRLGEDVS